MEYTSSIKIDDKFVESLKRAASDNDVTDFRNTLSQYPDKYPWIHLGDFGTAFHFALYKGTLEGETLEFFQYLIDTIKIVQVETRNSKFLKDFLNQKNSDGNTVLHVAAYCESDDLVKLVLANGSSLYSRNKKSYTCLDLMYAKTPQAVVSILDEAFKLVNERKILGDKPRGQERNLYIDFGPIVGKPAKKIFIDDSNSAAPFLHVDTSLLASLVRHQSDSSKAILNHVLTKIFLNLKWKKLAIPVYSSAAFYILIHLWYTLFVIQVFIVSFPYGRNIGNFTEHEMHTTLSNSSTPNVSENSHGVQLQIYLWGRYEHFWDGLLPIADQSENSKPILLWDPFRLVFRLAATILLLLELLELYLVSHIKVMGRSEWEFKRDIPWVTFIAVVLILIAHLTYVTTLKIFGIFFVLLQMLRLILSSRRETKVWMRRKVTRRDDNLFSRLAKVIINGLTIYLNSSENILLLIFLSYMIHVPGVNLDEQPIRQSYYVNAAFSVVLAWTLILLQFGTIFGLGRYLEMLKLVLGDFVKMTLTYFSIYVAYCIAFSILFPEDGLFDTLPLSLFRVLTMMGGELGVEQLLGEREDDLTPFPIARHLLYASFIIIVAIVMFNLLLGLTVENLEKISENSAVAYTTTLVERLYAMEAILNLIGKFVRKPINKICKRRRIVRRDDLLNGSLVNGPSPDVKVPFMKLPLEIQKEVRMLLAKTGRREIGRR